MEEIFRHIKDAFNSLWLIRPRGSSFEIITPFPAAGDKYVSVFITVQNGKYIATDGGWISDGVYNIGADAPELSKIFDRALNYFIDDFSILRTMAPSNRIIYFKSTPDARFIPNLVFEVANFVSIVSSMALVPFKDEIENRNIFRSRTSKFILEKVGPDRLKTNVAFSDSAPSAKFNAIVKLPEKKFLLINYVTGSTTEYMASSYSKSNIMFDLLHQNKDLSDIKSRIGNEIVIMDDEAKGYKPEIFDPYMSLSISKGQEPIRWSYQKRDLEAMLN